MRGVVNSTPWVFQVDYSYMVLNSIWLARQRPLRSLGRASTKCYLENIFEFSTDCLLRSQARRSLGLLCRVRGRCLGSNGGHG